MLYAHTPTKRHPATFLPLVPPIADRLLKAAKMKGVSLAGTQVAISGAMALPHDLVVPFDDDTPRVLIAACLPEILVKGGGYTAETTAGAAEVVAAGGRFVAVPFAFDRSTTALLAKVRSSG